MAESIKQRLNALSNLPDAYEVKFLEDAALADLTALRATMALIYADCVALRTKLAADIVDVAAMRTPIAATVTDVAAMRTPIAATVTDVAAMRTPIAATVVDVAALNARLNTAMISHPGLVIGSASKKVPKAGNAIQAVVGGTLVFKAADTAMSAITGTVAQNKFAIWAFYMDSAGTISSSTKTADANTAAAAYVLLPAIPANKVQIGFIIVTSVAIGGFVATTDDLDVADSTVIYVDSIGIQAPAITLTAAAPAALTASAPAALTASAPAALTASTPAALTSAAPSALTLAA